MTQSRGILDAQMEQRFKRLIEHDPYLGHRLRLVRYMLEDRGVSQAELARWLGLSRQRVGQLLNPSYVRVGTTSSRTGGAYRTVKRTHEWLDRIEAVITRRTEPPETAADWLDEVREIRRRQEMEE